MTEVEIATAVMPRDLAAVQRLCWEYRDYLYAFNADMRRIVDHFYAESSYAKLMADLPTKHARPRGIICLATVQGKPEGCGMYHPLSTEDCEIKRVFVRAQHRGTGAGEKLSRALVAQARCDGYRRVLLDTNAKFHGARRLYEKLGFRERGPYSSIPDDVRSAMVFYELDVSEGQTHDS